MSEKTVIYTKEGCLFCREAKELLKEKGHAFEEIDITDDPEAPEYLLEKTGGRRTVPQIFMNERHVGGYEDLKRFFHETSE